MDGRGGCCIARYGGEYDMSQVDRIMLRFRPIAPKPVNGGGLASGRSTGENGDVYVKSGSGSGSGRGRGKRVRRCVKQGCSNNDNNINKRRRSSKGLGAEKTVVTLPLLPETPEPKGPERERKSSGYSGTWLSFESFESNSSCISSTTCRSKVVGEMSTTNNMQQRRPVRLVGSCVTVDCLTDTWVDGEGLGSTDGERRMNLERDTCPGFVSNDAGRVVWTNGAYRRMVGNQEEEEETTVLLVTKERAAKAVGVMSNYDKAAFSCRVRVQYSGCGGSSAREWSSLTVPCDVWRMESGGFAWRLDAKAALCLGR